MIRREDIQTSEDMDLSSPISRSDDARGGPQNPMGKEGALLEERALLNAECSVYWYGFHYSYPVKPYNGEGWPEADTPTAMVKAADGDTLLNRATPSRPCAHAGCYSLQPCSTHPPPKPFAIRSYRAAGGRGWQKTRRRILERDGHLCRYCGGAAEVVDHILNRARGGTDADENLVACCKACNEKKRQQEARGQSPASVLIPMRAPEQQQAVTF